MSIDVFFASVHNSAWIAVLVFGIIFLIIEMTVPGTFLFLALATGFFALAAALFFQVSLLFSLGLGALTFVFSFVVMYTWLKSNQYSSTEDKNSNSNTDALRGQKGVVVEKIEPQKPGRIILGREEWSAASAHSTILPGQMVVVLRVEGNRAIVQEEQS